MAKVPWQRVSSYVEQAFKFRGRVERRDAMELAEANNASDDVIDAIDALGSRVFPNPDSAKAFLQTQGYIA